MPRPYVLFLFAGVLAAQQASLPATQDPPKADTAEAETAKPMTYTVDTGTRIPLNLLNSVSTKHSEVGDSVYLQTAFPVLVNGRIIIPIGSYVTGTVTQVKKASMNKGAGELYVRFDSLTLPNGVTRKFNARIGGADGNLDLKVDRAEGKVIGETDRTAKRQTIEEGGGIGAEGGAIGGLAMGHPMVGMGIGAGAGALIGVLMSKSPDAVLPKGATVEMVLDRPLSFSEIELN